MGEKGEKQEMLSALSGVVWPRVRGENTKRRIRREAKTRMLFFAMIQIPFFEMSAIGCDRYESTVMFDSLYYDVQTLRKQCQAILLQKTIFCGYKRE